MFADIKGYTLSEWASWRVADLNRRNLDHNLALRVAEVGAYVASLVHVEAKHRSNIQRAIQQASKPLLDLMRGEPKIERKPLTKEVKQKMEDLLNV